METSTQLMDDFLAIRAALKDGRVFRADVQRADAKSTTAVVSDGSPDRMGDVVEPGAWQLDNYRKNPVVLWSHNYETPPIGRCSSIAVVDGKLVATTTWARHAEAQKIAALYEDGTLTSFSVGFKPHEFKPIRDKSGEITGIRFLRCELLEYSAVAVPANPNASVLRSVEYGTVVKRIQRGALSVDEDPDVQATRLRKAMGEVSIERGPGFRIIRYTDHEGIERAHIHYT